jgi:hypothetical protein
MKKESHLYFAVSVAYEVAFTAPAHRLWPETKVLASVTNIFCVGAGIPNILCTFLYQACQDCWFGNLLGEVTRKKDRRSKNLTRTRNVPPKCNKQVTSKQQTRSFLTSIT